MDDTTSYEKSKILISLIFFLFFILYIGSSFAQAQSLDEDFTNFLETVCGSGPFGNNPPQLVTSCGLGGVSASGGGGSPTGTSNLGSYGALVRLANRSAAAQRSQAEARLAKLRTGKGGNTSGAGASADGELGQWGFFVSGLYGENDHDGTASETGYSSKFSGVNGGVDYRFTDFLVGGVMFGYTDDDGTFEQNAGNLRSKRYSFIGYGTLMPTENVYLDAYGGYTDIDYKRKRRFQQGNINAVAQGRSDGKQWLVGGRVGLVKGYKNWTMDMYGGVNYSRTDLKAFSETGSGGFNLNFEKEKIQSLTSVIGAEGSYAFTYTWGVLLPRLSGTYLHEFNNDGRSVSQSVVSIPGLTFTTQTNRPDRNYFSGSVGTSVKFTENSGFKAFNIKTINFFADVSRLFGHSFLDSWNVSGGIRVEL